jgi:cyanophycinase
MTRIPFVLLLFCSALFGRGYICAVGGGTENYGAWSDEPYRWMVAKSGNGPALVLHYSEGSVWLENYFKSFGAASASSLIISSKSVANDSNVYRHIRRARLLFLRGGDQNRYYSLWRNTLAEQAIRQVFEDGGVVGGTSAGLAVLGEVDYIASRRSAVSSEALLNPKNPDITLADDFLPLAAGVLFDSHFTRRGRLGRLLAFVANGLPDHPGLIGMGVDEHTAVCIDPAGLARIAGAGAAFIVENSNAGSFRCESGKPLAALNWRFHSLVAGYGYSVKTHQVIPPATAQTALPVPAADSIPLPSLCLDARAAITDGSLRWLTIAAVDKPFLVIYRKGNSIVDDLRKVGNPIHFNTMEIDPSSNPSQAEWANAIIQHDRFLMAGFNAADVGQVFAANGSAGQALYDKLANGSKLLVLCSDLAPLGELWIKNSGTDSYSLQNGRLQIAAGLRHSPEITYMLNAFKEDDFIENRVGGFFWQFTHSRSRLALLTDVDGGWRLERGLLQVTSEAPLLIVDGLDVQDTDSSSYRYRTYLQPRQTAAFTNAVLHCLPNDSLLTYDCYLRKIQTTTKVRTSLIEAPQEYRLRVYPNPARHTLYFEIGNEETATVAIFDLLGRQVAQVPSAPSGRWTRIHLEPFALCSGRYFLVWNHLGTWKTVPFTYLN